MDELKQQTLLAIDAEILNLDFNLHDFHTGMAIGALSIVLDLVFTKLFPTWSWLGYASRISLQTHPMTLFSVFSKISMEVYHQYKGESFPSLSYAGYDTLLAFAQMIIYFAVGKESFLLGLTMMELIKNFTVFSIMSD